MPEDDKPKPGFLTEEELAAKKERERKQREERNEAVRRKFGLGSKK